MRRQIEFVYIYAGKCRDEALNAINSTSEIGKIQKIFIVSPGTSKSYIAYKKYHARCLSIAKESLSHRYEAHAAAMEMIWRIHEYFLECENDISKTLDRLCDEAVSVGGEDNLLAECVLARHSIASKNLDINLIMLSNFALESLRIIGDDNKDKYAASDDSLIEQLSFELFKSIIGKHAPKLSNYNANKINSILNDKYESVIDLKILTKDKATVLITERLSEDEYKKYITDFLKVSSKNVQEILNIKLTVAKDIINHTIEDSTFWSMLAAFVLGSFFNPPPVISAAIGAAVLGTAIPSIIKTRKTITTRMFSPYRLVKHF